MKYIYYPGCSTHGSGRHCEEALFAVFEKLGIELEELPDWNCCGSTVYLAIDEPSMFALAARNLALTQKLGKKEIFTPCAGCFLALVKTNDYLAQYPELAEKVHRALAAVGLEYNGQVQVRHVVDILVNDYGLERLQSQVVRKLKGLRVAPYYGCQLIRPYPVFEDVYGPTSMDHLLECLGAEVVPYPLKTRCCGGPLAGMVGDVGYRLNYLLLKEAKRRNADLIVTCCPFCQFNLECYQDEISERYHEDVHIPILFIAQVMGVALGIPQEQLGFQRLLVSPEPALQKIKEVAHA